MKLTSVGSTEFPPDDHDSTKKLLDVIDVAYVPPRATLFTTTAGYEVGIAVVKLTTFADASQLDTLPLACSVSEVTLPQARAPNTGAEPVCAPLSFAAVTLASAIFVVVIAPSETVVAVVALDAVAAFPLIFMPQVPLAPVPDVLGAPTVAKLMSRATDPL
jgi:hypothetical protein